MAARQHIGLGPMGTAVFYRAHELDVLGELLDGGAALIDSSRQQVGSGHFQDLAIHTLSDPEDAIRFMPTTPPFGQTDQARSTRAVLESQAGQDYCTFTDLAAYYQAVGQELLAHVLERPGNSFKEATVDRVVWDRQSTTFTSIDRRDQVVARSREMVLATGGTERLHPDLVPFAQKVVLSADVLSQEKGKIRAALERADTKSLVVLGSGTSTIGVLGELNKLPEAEGFDVTVAYRSKFYLHYPSLDEALEAGYAPDPGEISAAAPYPVNRVRGLRTIQQQILEDAVQRNVRLEQFDGDLSRLDVLRNTGVIVQALGYQAKGPTLVDTDDRELELSREDGRLVVDASDQLLLADGTPIPRAYRVGMGTLKAVGWEVAGFVPEADHVVGPVSGVKAFQGPGGSAEQLLANILGKRFRKDFG